MCDHQKPSLAELLNLKPCPDCGGTDISIDMDDGGAFNQRQGHLICEICLKGR